MLISLQSETTSMRKDSGVYETNKWQKTAGISEKPWTHDSLAELDQITVEEDQVNQGENKIFRIMIWLSNY